MLQRPGCFGLVLFVLLFGGLFAATQIAAGADASEPAAQSAPIVAGASLTPDPSATVDALATVEASNRATADTAGTQRAATGTAEIAGTAAARTAMPDVLATTDAAGVATSQAARAWQTDTQVVRAEGTRVAETQTPASWTAVAVGVRSTADAAAADKAQAEAVLAWGTVTAAVATETERPQKEQTAAAIAEENRIATAIAIATADEARRQAAARAKYYGDMAAEGWGKLQVAIPYLLLAFFAIMALMGAGAVLNRIEAPTWPFRAKAKVIVDAGPAPTPKVDAPESIARTVNRRRRDLVRDDQRARLIAFVEAARRIAGDDATVIPPESAFVSAGYRSKAWRGLMIDELVALGLVDEPQPGNGGGTGIADDRTLAYIADVLEKGSE